MQSFYTAKLIVVLLLFFVITSLNVRNQNVGKPMLKINCFIYIVSSLIMWYIPNWQSLASNVQRKRLVRKTTSRLICQTKVWVPLRTCLPVVDEYDYEDNVMMMILRMMIRIVMVRIVMMKTVMILADCGCTFGHQ